MALRKQHKDIYFLIIITMDHDQQTHENREDASRSRKFLDRLHLYNITLYKDLIQNKQDIVVADRHATAYYDGVDVVRLEEKTFGTLYVVDKFRGGKKGKERQTITPATPANKPDFGTYTISFDKKKTQPIDVKANAVTINAALKFVGLGNLKATGKMETGITIEFGGAYENNHQVPVVIDSALLKIGGAGGNPIAPPIVKRVLPPDDNYIIAKQDKGNQFLVLLKQTGPDTREPVIPTFFTK